MKNPQNDTLRQWMVEEQIIPHGIYQKDLLASMRSVPRHLFVPLHLQRMAYDDSPLPIGEEQVITQPSLVAAMTQAAGISPDSKVLEVGTGSGYQAAILGEMAKEVFTIERIPSLAKKAEFLLQELGYKNIHVIIGDGTLGFPEKAPYDAILVAAGIDKVPKSLEGQLAERGKLVIPIGDRSSQKLMVFWKENEHLLSEMVLDWVRFVPLIGEEGW